MFWGDSSKPSKSTFHEVKISDFAGLEARIRSRPTVFLIYASWCLHCRVFKPQYSAFASKVKAARMNVQVMGIESEVLKALHQQDRKLFNFVTGSRGEGDMYFPKVMTFKLSGSRIIRKEYNGDRTEQALMAFAQKNLVAPAPAAAPSRKPARKGVNEQLHGAPRQHINSQ